MTSTEARNKIKYLVDLETANTDFDTEIDSFVTDAVDSLAPIVYEEYIPSDYSLPKNTFTVTLTTIDSDLKSIKEIFIKDSADSDDSFEILDSYLYRVRAGTLFFRTTFSQAKTLKIVGGKLYTITTIPAYYNNVIKYWGASQFYTMLAGNKRKFNQYQDIVGSRSIDAMASESERLEEKGNNALMDRADLNGA